MATRYRLGAGVVPTVSPGFSAGWTNTANAVRIQASAVNLSVTAAQGTSSPALTTGQSACCWQAVIGPIGACTISGTVSGMVRAPVESTSSDDVTAACAVRIVKPNMTDRAVLLAVTARALVGSAEFPTGATEDRIVASAVAIASGVALNGDYIVVELGVLHAGTGSAAATITLSNNGVDKALSDAAGSSTTNTWFEFSAAIAAYDPTVVAANARKNTPNLAPHMLKQSTAINWPITMIDSADHVSGKTGLTLTMRASKDGGAFAGITPVVTELENGDYSLALTTTHTNTLGALKLRITATGADPQDVLLLVRDNLPGDVYARVGAPAGASISADIAAAKVDTAAIKLQTDKLAFSTANKVDTDAFTRLGAPAGASVSADIAAAKTDTAAIKTKTDNLPANTSTVLGAPAGASLAADIAAAKVDTAAIKVKTDNLPANTSTILGAPVGASLSADIAAVEANAASAVTKATAIQAKTDNLPASPAATGDIPTASIAAIKAKTDNLPAAPADEGLIVAATDALMTRIGMPAGANVSADIAAVKSDSAAIKAKTDNLPSDPADASVIAGRLDTLDTSVAIIGDITDGIKAKTDHLPSVDAGAEGGLALVDENGGVAVGAMLTTVPGYR